MDYADIGPAMSMADFQDRGRPQINGWSPPTLYDIKTDTVRIATQQDVDRLQAAEQMLGQMVSGLRKVLADFDAARQELSGPSMITAGMMRRELAREVFGDSAAIRDIGISHRYKMERDVYEYTFLNGQTSYAVEMEIPRQALTASLNEFVERYLKPVAEQLKAGGNANR